MLAIAKIRDLLYHSPDAVSVDLAALLRETCRSKAIIPPERGIAVVCEAEPLAVDADPATPLALCAVELVTNAIKHAFGPGGGRIAVTLARRGPDAVLAVADDGRGLAAGRERRSGLRVVEALVARTGGRLAVETDRGPRTAITVPAAAAPRAATAGAGRTGRPAPRAVDLDPGIGRCGARPGTER